MKYILLVDDEPINIEIMEVILTDDYEIQSAENGIECLKSIDKRVPDLLLLDIAMPEMDGIEVCKALRSNEKTKKLPIVIVSGFATEEYMTNAREAGANDYITKPYKPEKLLHVVEKYV